jgi:quinoprotein glucose dehydrogenase
MIRWVVLLVGATLPALDAQPAKPQKDTGADWPMYNRDLAGTRYSPLKQIDTGNVAKIMRACRTDESI